MSRTLLVCLVAILLSQTITFAQGPNTVLTPTVNGELKQCNKVIISWQDAGLNANPPDLMFRFAYMVKIIEAPQGQANDTVANNVLTYLGEHNATSIAWEVHVASGLNVAVQVTTSWDTTFYSSPAVVQPGSDGCMAIIAGNPSQSDPDRHAGAKKMVGSAGRSIVPASLAISAVVTITLLLISP